MHILENYALNAAAKISNIEIVEEFYPLPLDKYITFHPTTKNSKTYDLWNEVLEILLPELKKLDINIVQLGSKDEPLYYGCYNTAGFTNINQVAYLVKNSLLHFGADTFTAHLAGHYNKFLVCLYSNNYIDCVKPYFGDSEKQCLLEPSIRKKGIKPTFSYNEVPKSINLIKPEDIAAKILNFLNIENTYDYKSIIVGGNYFRKTVEAVPDSIVNTQAVGVDSIILRADVLFNQEGIFNQLQHSSCSIITKECINPQIITGFKQRIHEIVYILDKDFRIDFIDFCFRQGVPLILASYLPEEEIQKLKIYLYNYGIIHQKRYYQKSDFQEFNNKDNDVLYYKSNKFLLSKGKIYPSLAAYKKDLPIKDIYPSIEPIINVSEFWEEFNNFYFLEKEQK